jgi:hypothetical protein
LWARQNVAGIEDPNGWESEVGTMAHAVLLGAGELPGLYSDWPARRTVARARDHARAMWSAPRQVPPAWTSPHPDRPVTSIERGEITALEFKRNVWRSVLGAFEVEDPAEVDVVATELEVKWEEGGVPFSCHPDRVERLPALGPGLAVVDLKTGKVPLKKYQPPYHRQVVIGSMGVAATMPQGPAQQGSLLYIGQSETVPVDTSLKARTETLRAAQGRRSPPRAARPTCGRTSGRTWDPSADSAQRRRSVTPAPPTSGARGRAAGSPSTRTSPRPRQ